LRRECSGACLPMQTITLNGRFYSHRPTGMQRYAIELVSRFGERLEVIRPHRPLRGGFGHVWEQVYLPLATRKRLLWSPNNTGPLSISRQVCTIHDLIPLDHPEWFNPRFVALYKWLMPRLVAQLQHVIAISEFTKLRLIEHFQIDPVKVSVVPNGVDSAFRPCPPERVKEVRKRIGLGEKPYVLCVSSLEPRKNLKRLLDAWARLPHALHNEYQLVLAGAKGNAAVFGDAGLEDPPPNAMFTGYVAQEDLPALYSGAVLFAYPSLYEGFGLPPLEAMACGVPVVTSGTSSIPEVTDGAAITVDPKNLESVTEGLRELMTNESLRSSLAERGLRRAAQLSWDTTARKTWAILEREAAMLN
jgi:glycosyltransferase involved in cell wall biosynthesis